jgi:hypothetical protein
MKSKFENTKHLPDVFYKYEWDGSEVIKTKITRVCVKRTESFSYVPKNSDVIRYISRPNKIKLGAWDGQRKAVFLEADNAEIEALKIMYQRYVDVFGQLSSKLTENIFTQKAMRQYSWMHGGTLEDG